MLVDVDSFDSLRRRQATVNRRRHGQKMSVLRRAFDEARAVHVGIDMQHKYCAQDPWDEKPDRRVPEQRIAAKLAEFTTATRAVLPPVWVNHVRGDEEDWRVQPGQDTGWRRAGLKVAAFLGYRPYKDDEFARRDVFGSHAQVEDPVIGKPGFDAFEGTDLGEMLRQRGADTLVLTGIYMDQCVMRTAESARQRGHEVFVVADLTMPGNVRTARQAMRDMRREGVRFVTAADVAAMVPG